MDEKNENDGAHDELAGRMLEPRNGGKESGISLDKSSRTIDRKRVFLKHRTLSVTPSVRSDSGMAGREDMKWREEQFSLHVWLRHFVVIDRSQRYDEELH